MMKPALLIAFSYLLGSVPFGIVFTKAKGIDLRSVGSGNIGATNVLRAAGKGTAVMTLLGDVLKGAAAVALARALHMGPFYEGMAGLAAVAGHDFSVFLGFRGGKGVATSIGVVLIYSPQAGILTVVLWLATVLATRYSSLGAVVSFTLLPAVMLLLGQGSQKVVFAALLAVLLLIKHAGNIKRLIRGTERRVGEKA
jgi:glycerol-3-phosphate acyltransferase PlsY